MENLRPTYYDRQAYITVSSDLDRQLEYLINLTMRRAEQALADHGSEKDEQAIFREKINLGLVFKQAVKLVNQGQKPRTLIYNNLNNMLVDDDFVKGLTRDDVKPVIHFLLAVSGQSDVDVVAYEGLGVMVARFDALRQWEQFFEGHKEMATAKKTHPEILDLLDRLQDYLGRQEADLKEQCSDIETIRLQEDVHYIGL